jgi:plasmid stabilization system protein ParE
MLPYELTPAAEADLQDIARYTLRQWGTEQARRYAGLLDAGFRKIADGSAISRIFSERYPQVRVARCEHHYIFYLHLEGGKPRLIAVLHERMDMIARISSRLSE